MKISPDHRAAIAAAETAAKHAAAEFLEAVRAARAAGASWADIGASLREPVTRQAAWERFAAKLEVVE